VSSSRRPAKRQSGAKAVAKRATATRTPSKRPTEKRPAGKSRPANRPAATTQPVPAAKPPPPPAPPGRAFRPRRLSEVELDEDEVLIEGFDAMLEGARVQITAVLERTCVYIDGSGDRRLARKIDLWVEANKLPIRRRSLG
jgi:hypothetical protein